MTHNSVEPVVIRLERTIFAPPHQVFRAWLEPDLLRRWLAPGSLDVQRVEVDERVGGQFRIWQTGAGTAVGGFECELLEIIPDQRLVFRWGFVGPERADGPVYDSLLTITFRETSQSTTVLTLVHERLDALAAALPSVAAQVAAGWELVLEKLVVTIGAAPR